MSGLSDGNGLSESNGLASTNVGLWSGTEGLSGAGVTPPPPNQGITTDAGVQITTDSGTNIVTSN